MLCVPKKVSSVAPKEPLMCGTDLQSKPKIEMKSVVLSASYFTLKKKKEEVLIGTDSILE